VPRKQSLELPPDEQIDPAKEDRRHA
jgi:hypothetical protein